MSTKEKMHRTIGFDASLDRIPVAPAGQRLIRITFETCPGSDLALLVVKDNSRDFDEFGMPRDSWWVIRTRHLPDRTTRLMRGTHSMKEFLKRYGFMDASGCVNHQRAKASYAPQAEHLPEHRLAVPPHLVDATGVPQFYPNSGICWYATLCWVSFSSPKMRDFMRGYLPPGLQPLCDGCLFSRDSAEALRKKLWYEYAVGDDVDDRPENDGRNGFSEFTTMCAKFGIPLHRFEELGGELVPMTGRVSDRKSQRCSIKSPAPGERHLLVVRFQDGDHKKFPVHRSIHHEGQAYRFVGIYAGQRHCGHQIGFSSTTGDWRDIGLTDADLHKAAIGPIFIRFDGKRWEKDWWDAWRSIVHVTKFGPGRRQFCNLSPHNEPDDSLQRYAYGRAKGSNSCDLVYLSA
jgi:hypothetical protein